MRNPGHHLDSMGYIVLSGFFSPSETRDALQSVERALKADQQANKDSILTSGDNIYAAGNLTTIWPECVQWAFHPRLRQTIQSEVGTGYGLVRAIFFDKNPDKPWGLPWHQDLTVAVESHTSSEAAEFHPTIKKGIPHIEASEDLLARMITARIHLDDADETNGALEVLPASHSYGKRGLNDSTQNQQGKLIRVRTGDLLLMRPLLYHRSAKPSSDNHAHRRVLHLEFAPVQGLPSGMNWYEFHAQYPQPLPR